jgi:hypothetical protein
MNKQDKTVWLVLEVTAYDGDIIEAATTTKKQAMKIWYWLKTKTPSVDYEIQKYDFESFKEFVKRRG